MISKPPMLSVSEALTFLLDAVRPITSHEIVPTLSANGRVLAAAGSTAQLAMARAFSLALGAA